jgi:hypothetical protein
MKAKVRMGGFLIAASALLLPATSIANPAQFTVDRERLERGEPIAFPENIDIGEKHYVGGVAYAMVDASPDELMGVLEDAHAWEAVLPKTKYATRISSSANEERVELHQGNALVDATYTLHLVNDRNTQTIRFWVDLNRPHTIEDAWGFFRWQVVSAPGAPPRILLSYGALVDVGPGILRSVYENRVGLAMLTVPQRLRAYVMRSSKRVPV